MSRIKDLRAGGTDDDPRFCGTASGDSDEMPRDEFLQLAHACDFLEHYATCHTQDAITRFRGKGGMPDIYVVVDQKWKDRFREFTKDEFPGR